MKEVADLLGKLEENRGPAPTTSLPDPTVIPEGHIHCACGKKFIPVTDVRYFDTKIIHGVADTICKECWPDVKDMIPLVCIRCKSVVSRVQPHKYARTGFEFRKGESYHVDKCPNCEKDIRSSTLIEKFIFEKANGFLKTK